MISFSGGWHLISQIKEWETAKADPARILPEFTTAFREADADEPFIQWLRVESSFSD